MIGVTGRDWIFQQVLRYGKITSFVFQGSKDKLGCVSGGSDINHNPKTTANIK